METILEIKTKPLINVLTLMVCDAEMRKSVSRSKDV